MKALGKLIQSQPAYITGLIQGAFSLLIILKVIHLSPTDLATVEGFALFVLMGWVHESVTPTVNLKQPPFEILAEPGQMPQPK